MLDDAAASQRPVLADATAVIETVFPVSRLSLESFKERDAKQNQTLTATGSYWKGRKPLILVRAAVLGCLLPSMGDDPESRRRDLAMFLKLMAMDDDGMSRRWNGTLDASLAASLLDQEERQRYMETSGRGTPGWKRREPELRRHGADLAFSRMSYPQKLDVCARPEELTDSVGEAWAEINAYYGTNAASMPAFVEELGQRRFGHRPRVSDRFAGGGSIPFEAARMGCDVEAADLNPVAGMLTWAALNVIGGSDSFRERLAEAQDRVASVVNAALIRMGVEHDDEGNRARVHLYCLETRCPVTGWMIPMSPTWVIHKGKKVMVRLVENHQKQRFDFECVVGATDEQMQGAAKGTCQGDDLIYTVGGITRRRSLKSIRGDIRTGKEIINALRPWTRSDFRPLPDDIYQERLFCIRWTSPDDKDVYTAPAPSDLQREEEVAAFVEEHLSDWQRDGIVPDMEIQNGLKTRELIRGRGWTHWHHLFNPRQLLLMALYRQEMLKEPDEDLVAGLTIVFAKMADHCTRLSRMDPGRAKPTQLFDNMAFVTFYNYGSRAFSYFDDIMHERYRRPAFIGTEKQLEIQPANAVSRASDLFITDPPYADAVVYHELTEFFIAWLRGRYPTPFAEWPKDSRRTLAIQGKDAGFRRGMIDAYKAMADYMPANGLQVVMFTHQDPAVWADLGMILWAAGLRVTAAWCITTEVEKFVSEGNHVQGTVLLVLRKRLTARNGWSDDVLNEVEDEVKAQLQSMLDLDDQGGTGGIRNFSDADYQLAAYAAALRVITGYATIDKRDVGAEVLRERVRGEKTEIQKLIERAVEVANNYLVPRGVSEALWAQLGREARFYLKMVEVEAKGDRQLSAYAEFARGFGLPDHRRLLGSDKANEARLRWAEDWKGRDLGESEFGQSLVRHVLFGIWKVVQTDATREAIAYLRGEVPDYWRKRQALVEVARFLANKRTVGKEPECEAAELLAGALSGDRI